MQRWRVERRHRILASTARCHPLFSPYLRTDLTLLWAHAPGCWRAPGVLSGCCCRQHTSKRAVKCSNSCRLYFLLMLLQKEWALTRRWCHSWPGVRNLSQSRSVYIKCTWICLKVVFSMHVDKRFRTEVGMHHCTRELQCAQSDDGSRDWQGHGCCPVLASHINNDPDILGKIAHVVSCGLDPSFLMPTRTHQERHWIF